MTVTLQGHVCRVAPYPISIEWPPRWLQFLPDIATCRAAVRERYQIGADMTIGSGRGALGFHQGHHRAFPGAGDACSTTIRGIAGESVCCRSPRRRAASCRPIRRLQQQTYDEVERINAKFAEGDWRPIVLIDEHQQPLRVFELYRAADFCLVNSLHDGMNLVAKEFVAARDDEDGVLILQHLCGCLTGAGGSGADQSLRCHRNRECHGSRHANGPRRAAQSHEPDAPDGQGKQCLSLGGTHADGRGPHSAAAEPAVHGVGASPSARPADKRRLSAARVCANARSRSAAARASRRAWRCRAAPVSCAAAAA